MKKFLLAVLFLTCTNVGASTLTQTFYSGGAQSPINFDFSAIYKSDDVTSDTTVFDIDNSSLTFEFNAYDFNGNLLYQDSTWSNKRYYGEYFQPHLSKTRFNQQYIPRPSIPGYPSDVFYTPDGMYTWNLDIARVGDSLNPGLDSYMISYISNNGLYNVLFDSTLPNSQASFVYTAGVSAVPVPGALFLFAPALLGFLGFRRKKKA